MDNYTACEQAYKNGYEKGKKDAVKRGEWIQGNPFSKFKCSVCGSRCFVNHTFDCVKTRFFPNCGANMTR